MIFPCMELFFVIFQVFQVFQCSWEPCLETFLLSTQNICLIGKKKIIITFWELYIFCLPRCNSHFRYFEINALVPLTSNLWDSTVEWKQKCFNCLTHQSKNIKRAVSSADKWQYQVLFSFLTQKRYFKWPPAANFWLCLTLCLLAGTFTVYF